MRARNWGNIGFLAAIGLSLFVIVMAGIKKSRSKSFGSIFRTSSELSATFQPTSPPSISLVPSSQPSHFPSGLPSAVPSLSTSPSSQPSLRPSISTVPSKQPSSFPSLSSMPSGLPSFSPTDTPSASPSYAPTGFFGTSTTILLDSGKSSATVAVIFVLAVAYATMYMCGGKGNQSDDNSIGSNSSSMINGTTKRRSGQYERKSECDESEILSHEHDISRHQSDDTIDTNEVYPTTCNINGVGTRFRGMNCSVPNCNGASPIPVPSNQKADTTDIDVEEGRGVTRPTSVVISKFFSSPFKNSGVSPLKTPTVFKKRQQSNIAEERFNRTRYNQDRNSSVFVRGNTPLTSKLRSNAAEKRSLTDDSMMNDNKHIANPYSNRSPEGLATCSDEESVIECSAYTNTKQSRQTDLQYYNKGRGFRYSETITINSNESSTNDDDDCTLVHQSPMNDYYDIAAEMEAQGIEVSSQYYDSDYIH